MWSSLLILMLLTAKPHTQKDVEKAKNFDCAPKIEKAERSCNKKCSKKKAKDKAVCQDACAEGIQAIKDACKEIAKNKGRIGMGVGGGGGGGGGSDFQDEH